MQDIHSNDIPIWAFDSEEEESEASTAENEALKASSLSTAYRKNTYNYQSLLPFAIVGAEEEITVGGRRVLGRTYPWGSVEGKILL